MHCSKAAGQLQLYIDRQLMLDQLRVLEAHIYTCSACQRQLTLLEEIDTALHNIELVIEPADLTANIMRRVALSSQLVEQKESYMLFRPSLLEVLTAMFLATVAMLGVILEQPALRGALPIANGHDVLSQIFGNVWHVLFSINSQTLMLGFWIIGTILGVWITLTVAGAEMRTLWFKSVTDRLPVL